MCFYKWLILISMALWLRGTGFVWALNVPLTVTNPSHDLERICEPVSSGVPIPEKAQIKNVETLGLRTDQGRVVPAQFKVLARWHGTPEDPSKPIRWVLVDFQADVPAGGKTTYFLVDEPPAIPGENQIRVETLESFISVDTGPAKFTIDRKVFNFFDTVTLKDADLGRTVRVLEQMGMGGLQLRDAHGKLFDSVSQPPETIEIEEKGPLKTVVRVRGVFSSPSGDYFAPPVHNSPEYPRFDQPYDKSYVYYDCRMHFYAGKSFVRIILTIENNGANGRTNPEQSYAPIQAVVFDQLEAVFRRPNARKFDFWTEGFHEQLQAGGSVWVFQDWRENLENPAKGTLEPTFAQGPYYEVHRNGVVVDTGARHSGWVHVADSRGTTLGLSVLHFWQNFPKKIQVSDHEVRLGLWPLEGYYPHCRSEDFPDPKFDLYCRQAGRTPNLYLLDGGRHKTHEFILSFCLKSPPQTTEILALILRKPLMALAPASWYAETKALGLLGFEAIEHHDEQIREAMKRFDRLQRALVDANASDNGWTIDALRTSSKPHWNYSFQNRFFGWMHFGDLLWSGQAPSALHYDWCLGMTLNYVRTGLRGFFDAAREMCRHRYDIDQYHGERTDTQGNHKWINHMAFYETDAHADPTISSYMPSRVAGPSHTWNGGLLIWYLLTGDRKALEAAEEVGQAAWNHYGPGGLKDATKQNCAAEETRAETWPMLNLIHLYRVTGDSNHLQLAYNIAKNRVLYREQKAGSQGYFGMGNNCDAIITGQQYNTMYSYALDPIIQVHYETQDEELGKLILRMADFMKDKYLFGGDTNADGLYRPLQSLYVWDEQDPDGSKSGKKGEVVKDTFNGDFFAYAYKLTGNPEYLKWARMSFRDTAFYYTVQGSTYINPAYRAKISFIDEMFAGTESKVHGWLGRTNQVYLNLEAAGSGGP